MLKRLRRWLWADAPIWDHESWNSSITIVLIGMGVLMAFGTWALICSWR